MQLLLKRWHLWETDKGGVLENRVNLADLCPMEHHTEVIHIKWKLFCYKKLDCDVLVAVHTNQMIEKSLSTHNSNFCRHFGRHLEICKLG